MPFVSVTRLRIRHWRFLPAFIWQAFRSSQQAKSAPGNVSVSVLNDRDRAFWTRTVWTDERAMKNFMLAGAHRGAMPKLAHWCDEAALTHWIQEDTEAPTWDTAYAHLKSEGRRSKVHHPSAAHEAFEFPPPRITSGGGQ